MFVTTQDWLGFMEPSCDDDRMDEVSDMIRSGYYDVGHALPVNAPVIYGHILGHVLDDDEGSWTQECVLGIEE